MWNAVSDTDKGDVEFGRFFPKDASVAGEEAFIQPYADSPMDDIHVGEDVYISIVEKAVKYCYFVTPYLIITDEMAHAMALAAERGVDVRVITPGIPDKKMVYSVTRSFYNSLARHGVRMYEWTPGFCHAKMCVADDIMATCGTINLDYRSLYHHFENGCFIAHSEVVLDIRRDFEKMFSESTEVTEEYSTVKSSYLKFSQLFLRLFAELM
jgi:cardiolipin synthase